MMHITEEGLRLIRDSEQFKSRLYNCPAGHCTVGYGHLVHRGNCCGDASELPFANGISEAEAENLLRREVAEHEMCIARLVKVPLDQSEFDALVDFEYNLGCGSLAQSTLLKKLNAGDYDGTAS